MTAPFLLGLLLGAGAFALLLVPRVRTATEAARVAREAEKAAQVQAAREGEHAARVSAERESAHQRQLADLRAATEEKLALVAGNREQFAEQMKAISPDTLRGVLPHGEGRR